MQRGADRRVAIIALSMVVVIFVVLLTTFRSKAKSPDAILRDLVQNLVRSDRLDVQIDYTIHRVTSGGRVSDSSLTTWFRRTPYLKMSLAGEILVVESSKLKAQCLGVGGSVRSEARCTRIGEPETASDTSLPFFIAVKELKRYVANALPSRTIAGQVARCFQVGHVAGEAMMAGLGERVSMCFASDGALLRSEIVRTEGSDVRTAVRIVRGVTRSEVARVTKKYGDALIAGV